MNQSLCRNHKLMGFLMREAPWACWSSRHTKKSSRYSQFSAKTPIQYLQNPYHSKLKFHVTTTAYYSNLPHKMLHLNVHRFVFMYIFRVEPGLLCITCSKCCVFEWAVFSNKVLNRKQLRWINLLCVCVCVNVCVCVHPTRQMNDNG